jgi:hypothetical protein
MDTNRIMIVEDFSTHSHQKIGHTDSETTQK